MLLLQKERMIDESEAALHVEEINTNRAISAIPQSLVFRHSSCGFMRDRGKPLSRISVHSDVVKRISVLYGLLAVVRVTRKENGLFHRRRQLR